MLPALAVLMFLSAGLLPLSAQSSPGEGVYKHACAGCHAKAAERVPSEATLRQLSARHILRTLETGTMALVGLGLTREQKIAVAEYTSGGKSVNDDDSGWLKQALCAPSSARKFTGLKGSLWTGWSPIPSNTRWQPEPGLSVAEASRLELRWSFAFPGDAAAFAQPTYASGRLFVGSAGGDVYSLDAKTGCVWWRYRADASVRTAITLSERSASERGRYTAYFGDFSGTVYAVDAEDGKLLWKRRLDHHAFARITATPTFHNGRLYVGVSSLEEAATVSPAYECCTFRGSLHALDARTGEPVWKTWTIPEAAKPTIKNKAGRQVHGPSGAAVWAAPTIDARRGLLYIGTGDNYTYPASARSDAVVAVRISSGEIVWSRQFTPNDVWHVGCASSGNCEKEEGPDHDFGSSPMLIRHGDHDLLIAAQKSGHVYALNPDREGELRWQTRVALGGIFGGIQWGPATDGEHVYAAISDHRNAVRGIRMTPDPKTGGGLVALRLADGSVAWKAPAPICGDRPMCSPAQMAAVSGMPGVIFSGARDGYMRAYSAANGKLLWAADTARSYDTVNGVNGQGGSIDGGGPCIAGGMVFFNSGYSWFGGRPGNVLLAFAPASQP